jgi:hypothetical protein
LQDKILSEDKAGNNVLMLIEQKNASILRCRNKDINSPDRVHGEEEMSN